MAMEAATPTESAMELFDTTHLLLERALEGASARQDALAANLANVNTPGYQRRDVPFQESLRAAMTSGDQRASLASMAPTASVAAPSGSTQPDGNGVELDVESAQIAENGLLSQALTSVMSARIAIMRSAIGTGS